MNDQPIHRISKIPEPPLVLDALGRPVEVLGGSLEVPTAESPQKAHPANDTRSTEHLDQDDAALLEPVDSVDPTESGSAVRHRGIDDPDPRPALVRSSSPRFAQVHQTEAPTEAEAEGLDADSLDADDSTSAAPDEPALEQQTDPQPESRVASDEPPAIRLVRRDSVSGDREALRRRAAELRAARARGHRRLDGRSLGSDR